MGEFRSRICGIYSNLRLSSLRTVESLLCIACCLLSCQLYNSAPSKIETVSSSWRDSTQKWESFQNRNASALSSVNRRTRIPSVLDPSLELCSFQPISVFLIQTPSESGKNRKAPIRNAKVGDEYQSAQASAASVETVAFQLSLRKGVHKA